MINVINFAQPTTASFLVDIIVWITSITASIAVGIVLFTVLLKIITLPFDFFSKVSMKKNALKMEEMRPELEKLQKQYADNKQLYNQKMMALYKKNGYSMWGSCLPTILMLVVFIVAINAFTNYSKFQNLTYFYNMSNSYNNAIYSGLELDDSETDKKIYRDEKGKLIFDDKYIIENTADSGVSVLTLGSVDFTINKGKTEGQKFYTVSSPNGYISCTRYYSYNENSELVVAEKSEFNVVEANLNSSNPLKSDENNNLLNDGHAFGEVEGESAKDFILGICQSKSAEKFREEKASFLWVKNIWITDSPLSHPVESDWSKFKSTNGYKDTSETMTLTADDYNNLISKLSEEKNSANGYFILAILTAGFSFLMQFVTNKSQKAQMELQTVDGQGARTQKMMMWMMPIMMAFFSFMYTSAFSIYMIISSVLSILFTIFIDWFVSKRYKNKKIKADSGKVRGRVYNAKEVQKQQEQKKKEEEKKKERIEEIQAIKEGKGDFIPQKEVKKHVRGRLKK